MLDSIEKVGSEKEVESDLKEIPTLPSFGKNCSKYFLLKLKLKLTLKVNAK